MKKIETISIFSKAPIGHTSLLGKKRMTYNPQGIKENGIKKVGNNIHGRMFGGENGKSARPNQIGREYMSYTNFPNDVLYYDSLFGNSAIHPTQKPTELLEYLIKTYSSKGDTILDNTMGSGSTGVAAVLTNRKFIGIELDTNYFDIAQKRINDALFDK